MGTLTMTVYRCDRDDITSEPSPALPPGWSMMSGSVAPPAESEPAVDQLFAVVLCPTCTAEFSVFRSKGGTS